jgi:hypothetical protein
MVVCVVWAVVVCVVVVTVVCVVWVVVVWAVVVRVVWAVVVRVVSVVVVAVVSVVVVAVVWRPDRGTGASGDEEPETPATADSWLGARPASTTVPATRHGLGVPAALTWLSGCRQTLSW